MLIIKKISLILFLFLFSLNINVAYADEADLLKLSINQIEKSFEIIQLQEIYNPEKILYANTTCNIRESYSIESEVCGQTYLNQEFTIIGLTKNGWYQTKNNTYIYKDYLSKNKTNTIEQELSLLPQKIRQVLNDNGWTITQVNLAPGYIGLTYYAERKIEIDTREIAVTTGVIHEVGHAIDYHYNCIAGEFYQIYLEEVNNYPNMSAHCRSDTTEYWAECFYLYYKNNGNLKRYCPKTYSYIESVINSI